MIDIELTKKLAIILSFSVALSTVSVFFGLLDNKIDESQEDMEDLELRVIEDLKSRVLDLEANSKSRVQIDNYQNETLKELKQAVFIPKSEV
jgi:hypothetical protein